MDLTSLSQNLQRVASKGNFRLQTQSIGILLAEVRNYVQAIKEDKEALNQESTLKSMISRKPGNPKEELEVGEAKKLLEHIKTIKRNMDQKEAALRSLEKEVNSLLGEIRQASKL